MLTTIEKNSDFLTNNALTSAMRRMGRHARHALAVVRRHNRAATGLAVLLTMFGTSAALKADGPPIFYYDQQNGHYALTYFDRQAKPFTIGSDFLPKQWTAVVDTPRGALFYDKDTGNAALVRLALNGKVSTSQSLQFGAGWTHIINHKGYLLFYADDTGLGVVGDLGAAGFKQFPATYRFSPGWSKIVSSPTGLLFYNTDGSAASGDWQYDYQACATGSCVSNVRYVNKKNFISGTFFPGWTQIVNTSDGILFYRAGDGYLVQGDLDVSGSFKTRPNSSQTLSKGYTGVAVSGQTIEFYNRSTGDGATGKILGSSSFLPPASWGKFHMDKLYPRAFSGLWDFVVAVDLIVVN